MKKSLIRSASIMAAISLLTACEESENPEPIVFPDGEYELPAPPPTDFSEVTVASLKAFTPDLHIGVAVPFGNGFSNGIENRPEIKTVIETHFNQLSAENIMKQTYLQPTEGVFAYTEADKLVAYAKSKSLTVHGHVLVWHSQIADWMKNFTGDKAAWVTMMETHATEVATHFEEAGDNDTVTSWDVVNEAFMENGNYRGAKTTDDENDASVWYENIGEEFIPLAFTAARAADPDADLYYNDYNLIWNTAKLDAVIVMAQAMVDDGVAIDGIGFQSHISLNSPAISTIKNQFQKVVDLGLKVKITELDVRMNNESGTPYTELTAERAEEQKEYYKNIVAAYLEIVPEEQRGGITVWGTVDGDSWLQSYPEPTTEWPLMFNDDYSPKPALQGFADALELVYGEADPVDPVDPVDPDGSNNLVVDFEADSTTYTVMGDDAGSAVVSEDPTDATKEALKVTITSGYGAGVAMPVTIPVGKTLENYSAVTLKVYYTAEGDADIADKRIQLLAIPSGSSLPDAAIIQWNGTWELDGKYEHLGVMDNAKGDATASTAFQTYTFDLTDGNVEDLLDGSTIADVTKALTGDIDIVFGFPHSGSTFYIDELTLVAAEVVVIEPEPETPAAFFNTDFETDLDSWEPRGDATVTLDTTQAHAGSNSALVEGRTATWQGISKDVVGLFTADETYNVSAWVKLSDDASTVTPGMKLTLEIKYGVDTTEYIEMTAPVTVAAGDWVELTGTYTHMITTEANEANLYIEADDIAVDFYVDDISIVLEGDAPDVPETPAAFFNTDFETDLDSWGPRGDATVTLDTTQAHAGSNSALVEGRTATWQGISKDVVGLFTAGETYNISAWVKLSDDASTVTPGMKLTLEINHGEDTTDYLEMTAPVTVTAGDWVELTGSYTHAITTETNSANLYVEGDDIAVDFYVDDISITVVE